MSTAKRHSKFKNVFATAFKKDKCYDGIKVSKSPFESNKSDVNGKFLAVILESQGGGSFLVLLLSQVNEKGCIVYIYMSMGVSYIHVYDHGHVTLPLALRGIIGIYFVSSIIMWFRFGLRFSI